MLGIYTWYMGPENYEELRLSGHTDVLIPLLPDPYSLPVYFMLYHESPHGAGVECWLQRPYAPSPARMTPQNTEKHVRHYGNHMTRFSFMVEAKSAKSGTYTVSCRGKYYYQPDSAWYPVHVKKEITLRFEKSINIQCYTNHVCIYIYIMVLDPEINCAQFFFQYQELSLLDRQETQLCFLTPAPPGSSK